MQEYQKIPSLYLFDPAKKKYIGTIANPYVDYLQHCTWITAEKIDGTNIRVEWDGHKVSWNGRTDKANLPTEIQDLLAAKFGDAEIMFEQMFGEKTVILFMECYGGKIQGGLYGGKERLIGFDVAVNGSYLDKLTIKPIFDAFGIETVKFKVVLDLNDAIKTVFDAVAHPTQYISPYSDPAKPTIIEGLVCVPAARIYDNQGKRVIVKIKVKDLAKYSEN